MNMDNRSPKAMDMEKIAAYIGKFSGAVFVRDIKQHSGADPLRVYPILFELEQRGIIETVETSAFGAPLKVRNKETE